MFLLLFQNYYFIHPCVPLPSELLLPKTSAARTHKAREKMQHELYHDSKPSSRVLQKHTLPCYMRVAPKTTLLHFTSKEPASDLMALRFLPQRKLDMLLP